jgi:hypothetical protein
MFKTVAILCGSLFCCQNNITENFLPDFSVMLLMNMPSRLDLAVIYSLYEQRERRKDYA